MFSAILHGGSDIWPPRGCPTRATPTPVCNTDRGFLNPFGPDPLLSSSTEVYPPN